MSDSRIIKVVTEEVKIDICTVFIILVLILMAVFSAINLVSILNLKKQTNLVLTDVLKYSVKHSPIATPVILATTSPEQAMTVSTSTDIIDTPLTPLTVAPTTPTPNNTVFPVVVINNNPAGNTVTISEPVVAPLVKTYSNIISEPFFGNNLINTDKTNLLLDDNVTALVFNPSYKFNYEQTCSQPFCGYEKDETKSCLNNKCLTQKDGKIYYENNEVKLPSEIKGRAIKNITLNPLSTKWLIGFVISDGNQESAYIYFFENNSLTALPVKFATSYSRGGGSIAASGTDNQFMLLYFGYEGLGYLYNNGAWQDLSKYLGLRLASDGFKARIIKGGDGTKANWYICSDDISKPRLIKMWQNDTKYIQGVVDLTSVLKDSGSLCGYKNDRELSIARNNGLYSFKDNGFDNGRSYLYQSNNLSSFSDKKITSVYLDTYTINARPNSYAISFSTDGKNWQKSSGTETKLINGSDTLYAKVEFKAAESDYSPWFGGLESILYSAIDR